MRDTQRTIRQFALCSLIAESGSGTMQAARDEVDCTQRQSTASSRPSARGMRLRAAPVCAVLVCCAISWSGAQVAMIPEADRYIKLGTRLPEVPYGEGGELHIVADQNLCRDATYILEVHLLTDDARRPAVRLSMGPGACTWLFERMTVGRYEAFILTPRDGRIAATGHGSVSKGTGTLITMESAQTEIEGRLASQAPLPSPLRLTFTLPSGNWTARVAPDGSYRVQVIGVQERTRLAIWAEADGSQESESTAAFNVFQLLTTTISRGLTRLDLDDVTLPPVVVHVEVPPVADARYDEFAQVSVGRQTGHGFKLIRGLRGQFLAAYGEHTIEIWTNDRQHMLATKVVDVRPPDTESRVVVTILRR